MAGTHIDEFEVVTLFEVVQDRCVIQVGQIGHVFALLEFRRVHLLQQVFLERLLL